LLGVIHDDHQALTVEVRIDGATTAGTIITRTWLAMLACTNQPPTRIGRLPSKLNRQTGLSTTARALN
jgi:hypothetical protein